MTTPDTFLGTRVPEHIKQQWKRWEGATWRQLQHRNNSRMYPPDERFNVRMPQGMCEAHRQLWLDYRNMHFDPQTGDRWPGNPGSPFLYVGHDMGALLEQRRVEWDEKASEQMRFIERICLAGGSSQCTPKDESAVVVALPTAGRSTAEVLLPEEEAS